MVSYRRQKMSVRQTLDFQTTRFVADENPVPFRPHTRSQLDQFLIDQPRLDGPKVSDARARNLFDFLSRPDLAVIDAGPMSKIHGLFKQMGFLKSTHGFS